MTWVFDPPGDADDVGSYSPWELYEALTGGVEMVASEHVRDSLLNAIGLLGWRLVDFNDDVNVVDTYTFIRHRQP